LNHIERVAVVSVPWGTEICYVHLYFMFKLTNKCLDCEKNQHIFCHGFTSFLRKSQNRDATNMTLVIFRTMCQVSAVDNRQSHADSAIIYI